MKPLPGWTVVALAVAFMGCLSGAIQGADPVEQREEAARSKDKAWKPATVEVGVIQVGNGQSAQALKNFCLDAQGNILACYAPSQAVAGQGPGIRVYSPDGKLVKTLPLEINPGAACAIKD